MCPADLTLLRIARDMVVRTPIAGGAFSCIAAKRKKIARWQYFIQVRSCRAAAKPRPSRHAAPPVPRARCLDTASRQARCLLDMSGFCLIAARLEGADAHLDPPHPRPPPFHPRACRSSHRRRAHHDRHGRCRTAAHAGAARKGGEPEQRDAESRRGQGGARHSRARVCRAGLCGALGAAGRGRPRRTPDCDPRSKAWGQAGGASGCC